MTIELTVCIPAYNAADVIERAIASVIDEPIDGGIEILVCDDGSDDDTAAIVERLAAERDTIRLIRNPQNLGRPATRNHLLREARGRFLTWLDADDEKYAGMLVAQLGHLKRIERESGTEAIEGLLVFTNYHWWRADWEEPKLIEPPEDDDSMEPLLNAKFGGYLWLMMGLRDTFVAAGPFDEKLPRLQDLGFFIRFAELGGRFAKVDSDEAMCVYYKDDSGRDAVQVWKSWNRIWRTYRHHFESYGMDNARRWRRHHYRVARRFAANNHDKVTFWRIAAFEFLYIVRGRLRRVIFDA